jgi:tetratricopeptide (TPR) repeat protein
VLRILRLQERQLAAWERAGLIEARSGETNDVSQYTFEELGQLRTLRDLSATRLSVRSIRASVDAMQRVAGLNNPLREVSAVQRGRRVTFRHGGALVDPLTPQLAFDFEQTPQARLRVVGGPAMASAAVGRRTAELQEIFLRAVRLEESPESVEAAATLYESILAADANHAAAAINLGTIYYNRRECERAEQLYRRATESDPEYALAFFDLGNVLDELQRLPEAIASYQRAVALVPQYADAHYNLALALERIGQRRRALSHWQTYTRLDPAGPWSAHARAQAKKILGTERLSIVSRHGRTASDLN